MTHRTHAVIQGTFINYKRYPRQNCTHLLIEIPIEYTNKYVNILGEPTAANPISVAVARLQDDLPANAQEGSVTSTIMSQGESGGGVGFDQLGYTAPADLEPEMDWLV